MTHDTTLTEEQVREIARDEFQRCADEPSRLTGATKRDVLRGAALLGGAAASASLGTLAAVGNAAAQSGSGTIGTQDAPLDAIYVDNLHQSTSTVDTNELQIDSNTALLARAANGQVQLSSGAATVDTGISATDATFYLGLGIDDPGADCKVAGRLFWDDSAGTYKVEIVEDGTSVGNPTVNYDVFRVR